MFVGLTSGTLFLIWFACSLWYAMVGGPLPWESFWPFWIFYGTPLAILSFPKRVRRLIGRKIEAAFWWLDGKINKVTDEFLS
jgi:hypothetical protein